jgi:hypothetical protein
MHLKQRQHFPSPMRPVDDCWLDPKSEIGIVAVGRFELALIHGNRDEAIAAFDYAAQQREEDRQPITDETLLGSLRTLDPVTLQLLDDREIFTVGQVRKIGPERLAGWYVGPGRIRQLFDLISNSAQPIKK